MKYIELKPLVNRVIINLKTLKAYKHPVYIDSKCKSNWVQVKTSDVEAFIVEQKDKKTE